MRPAAPVISGAAIVVAVAVVWYFRPQPESSLAPEATEAPAPPAEVAPRVADSKPSEVPSAGATRSDTPTANAASSLERSPLPGETPSTPMAQMLADRQQNVIVRDNPGGGGVPGLVEGEREFAAEPIDTTWAPGAEAELLAKFAQMPGLKLIDLQVECRSTMCRFVLTQPAGPALQGSPDPWAILRAELGLTPRWMMSITDRPGAPMKSIAYLWRQGFARRDCFKDGEPTPCSAEADEGGN